MDHPSVRDLVSGAVGPGGQSELVQAALEEYLAERERGGRPGHDGGLARHPDLAAVPKGCLVELARRVEGARPEAEPAPELPRLGDFQIVREIGRGGMGVVYEAEQLSLR